MEDKNQKKKKTGLIVIIIAAALLLVGGGVTFGILKGKNVQPTESETETETETEAPTESESPEPQVWQYFWNVDRYLYAGQSEIGMSSRGKSKEDGLYHILFAVDGRQVTRRVQEKKLVNTIDGNDVMGLVFGENNVVVEVKNIKEISNGYAVAGLYFESLDEDGTMHFRTSSSMAGQEKTFKADENLKLYDVSGAINYVGMEIKLKDLLERDRIFLIENKDGSVTTGFVVSRYVEPTIYWNVVRMYNSDLLSTTREPNAEGIYEIQMAANGEQVVVRVKDRNLVNQIDKNAAKCLALEFDMEGYVSGVKSPSQAYNGKVFGSWAHVLSIDYEKNVYAKKIIQATDYGVEHNAKMSDKCKVFDVSGTGAFVGEVTELQQYDQIHGITDSKGEIAILFVVGRAGDSPCYWNVERMYDSTKKVTTRKPNSKGLYEITLAHDGTNEKFYVTKDIATQIDANPARCVGLKFTDGEITGVTSGSTTRGTGGSVVASWFEVQKIIDSKTFFAKKTSVGAADYGEEATVVMSADCEVINGSQNYTKCCGEYTKVQVGDQVHCLTNVLGEARVVLVVNRPIDLPLSWNENRQYDSVKKETTRKPDANGYYVFEMLRNGERVILKTKNKNFADTLDASPARLFALKTSGDIITQIYGSTKTIKTMGGVVASWYDVNEVNGNLIKAEKTSAGASDFGQKAEVKVSSATKIYNVSGIYEDHAGEITTVKVGDVIHCLKNKNDVITYIFVVSRKVEPVTKTCPICGEEVTFQPFNGVVAASTDGKPVHYYMAKTQSWSNWGGFPGNTETHLDMNSKTQSGGAGVRLFYADAAKAKAKLVVFDASSEKKGTLKPGTGISDGTKGAAIAFLAADSYVTFKDITIDLSNVEADANGAIYVGGGLTLDNVTVKGGVVSKGGAVVVPAGKVVTILGNTSVTGGKLKDGTNANLFFEAGAFATTNGAVSSTAGSIGVRNQTSGKFADASLGKDYQNIFKADVPDASIVKEVDNTLSMNYTITGISFSESEKELEVGVPTRLQVKMTPVMDDTIKLVFTSSDPTSVTVDANGQVMALKAFETPVTVTVKTQSGTFSGEIKLTAVDHTASQHYHVEGTHAQIQNATGTKIVYQPWESETALPMQSGYFYLTKDIVLTDVQPKLPTDTDIHLCLNGHTVKQNKEGNIQLLALFYTGSTFSLCDCSSGETGKLISEGTFAQPGRTVWVRYGTFNMYGGTLVGSDASTKQGGNVKVDAGATFNMYGGKLSGGQCSLGGLLYVNGKVNIYGGTIENGQSTGSAGSIFCDTTAEMYIENATIKGGYAKVGGGNMRFQGKKLTIKNSTISGGKADDAGGNLQILGGTILIENTTISGGTAPSAQKAEMHINQGSSYEKVNLTLRDATVDGGILLQNAENVILSGKTKIGNDTAKMGLMITNNGSFTQKVSAQNLDAAAKIYVSCSVNGIIIYDGAANIANFVSYRGTGYRFEAEGNHLKLTNEVVAHTHCVCGGTITSGKALGGGLTHTCSTITWAAWDSDNTIPLTAGNYYLTKDIVLSANQPIIKGANDVKICLNGHNITQNKSGNIQLCAVWESGGSLTITDCTNDATKVGTLKTEGTFDQPGRVLWVRSGGTINIYAGNFIGADAGSKAGGAINVAGGATLNLFGGKITGTSSLTGPAVYSNGTLNIYGGTIQGGTTTNNGGSALWASTSNSVTKMYGGQILGGTVNKGSGNVFGGTAFITSSATFYQYGGLISGATVNTTADWRVAGAIYIAGNATYNLVGGKITGTDGLTRGGCIDVEEGTLNMSGGEIEGAHVTKYGGAVLINTKGVFNMTGGMIYGGQADLGTSGADGQNIANSGTMSVSDGLILLDKP